MFFTFSDRDRKTRAAISLYIDTIPALSTGMLKPEPSRQAAASARWLPLMDII